MAPFKKFSKYLDWTGANKTTRIPSRKTLVHLKCPNHQGDENNTSELYTQPADNEEHQQSDDPKPETDCRSLQ